MTMIGTVAPLQHHFEIPRLATVARHAVPHVVEATLIPLALFYLSLWRFGTMGAICAAVAWGYLALLRRLVRRRRISGILLLSTLGLTARTALALVAHSTFVYFLQPCLATAAVGALFLFSIPVGRPLAQKLASDFVPFPPEFFARPAVRRVFVQITVIWALVNLLNAGVAILLLVSQPVGTYVATKTVLSAVVTGSGIAVSAWWFKRVLRDGPAATEPVAMAVLGA